MFARAIIAILLGTVPMASATDLERRITRTKDADTGRVSWKWEAGHLSLELAQRLPDQSRAFFEARGFVPEAADVIARECVFQTIIRNTAADPTADAIEVDLSEWRALVGSQQQSLRLRNDWSEEWARFSVSESARIAFQWSLFPTRQRFEPGDYNWGMTVYGLPADTHFDLHLVWHIKGSKLSGILRDLHCPPDSDL